jgi:hypothetical protein
MEDNNVFPLQVQAVVATYFWRSVLFFTWFQLCLNSEVVLMQLASSEQLLLQYWPTTATCIGFRHPTSNLHCSSQPSCADVKAVCYFSYNRFRTAPDDSVFNEVHFYGLEFSFISSKAF